MTDSIVYQLSDQGVATVTLNRPEQHNAFDDAIIKTLTDVFQAIDADHSARIMVLAAAGKSFSAGADLAWMKRMANYSFDDNLADSKGLAAMLHALNFMSIPTIARVQGAAFGGAVGLISCCDIAIASEDAKFCLSEVKLGLIPATIAPYVISAIGERAARRYFLSAERFHANQAKALGLLSEVVKHDELDNCVATLIEQISHNSPAAMTQAKELIFAMSNRVIDEPLIHDTCERISRARASDEGQEGLSAFLAKRRPSWINDDHTAAKHRFNKK